MMSSSEVWVLSHINDHVAIFDTPLGPRVRPIHLQKRSRRSLLADVALGAQLVVSIVSESPNSFLLPTNDGFRAPRRVMRQCSRGAKPGYSAASAISMPSGLTASRRLRA
jgi:hypothetical protein